MANPDRKPDHEHDPFGDFQPPPGHIEASMAQLAAGDLFEVDEAFDAIDAWLDKRQPRTPTPRS